MMLITLPSHPHDYNKSVSQLATGYIDAKWWPELKLELSLTTLAADFYLFYAMKDGDETLQTAFNKYCHVVAKQIAVYLDACIGGELRHKQFNGLKAGSNMRSIARGDWRGMRLKQGHTLLQDGRNRFYRKDWSASYGGAKWGQIADTLVAHLTGETSAALFIDQAFALQHNNNTVFDKILKYWFQDHFKTVLDANLNENWKELLSWCSPWARTLFTEWLTAEDDLQIQYFTGDSRRFVTPPNSIVVGARVRVKSSARSVKWRNCEGTVVKTWGKSAQGHPPGARINSSGVEKDFSQNSLDLATVTSGAFEYIRD